MYTHRAGAGRRGRQASHIGRLRSLISVHLSSTYGAPISRWCIIFAGAHKNALKGAAKSNQEKPMEQKMMEKLGKTNGDNMKQNLCMNAWQGERACLWLVYLCNGLKCLCVCVCGCECVYVRVCVGFTSFIDKNQLHLIGALCATLIRLAACRLIVLILNFRYYQIPLWSSCLISKRTTNI